MYSYISRDGSLTVAGDTLIMYSGMKPEVVVPAEAEPGHPIHRIGDGAFMGTKVEKVVLPYGITQIGSFAFERCDMLKSVTIPDSVTQLHTVAFYTCPALKDGRLNVTYSQAGYNSLLEDSVEGPGGIMVVAGQDKSTALAQLISSVWGRPVFLHHDTGYLFVDAAKKTNVTYAPQFRDESGCICLSAAGAMNEYEAARAMIGSGEFFSEDAAVEALNDSYIRADKVPQYTETVLAFFRKQDTVTEKGLHTVSFKCSRGLFFRPGIRRTRWNGRWYYIHIRYYLTGDRDAPYLRRETAVLDENGNVITGELTAEIYAKYKLSAMF